MPPSAIFILNNRWQSLIPVISLTLTAGLFTFQKSNLFTWMVTLGMAHFWIAFYFSKEKFLELPLISKSFTIGSIFLANILIYFYGPTGGIVLFSIHWALSESYANKTNAPEMYFIFRTLFYTSVYFHLVASHLNWPAYLETWTLGLGVIFFF